MKFETSESERLPAAAAMENGLFDIRLLGGLERLKDLAAVVFHTSFPVILCCDRSLVYSWSR